MDREKESRENKIKKQVPLRLSATLFQELSRWAEEDFRSLNGQIEYLLTDCVNNRKHKKFRVFTYQEKYDIIELFENRRTLLKSLVGFG